MAALLHRIGRWSARHHWSVVVAWLLVIAVAGTGAVVLGKPLGNDFTIPGSRFQEVLDELEREIPEASGVIGTVTFSTEDGFTEDQRAAVADVTEEWSAIDGVIEATDPFEVQAQLDGTGEQLAQGREAIEAGRAELEAGRAELAAGQEQVDAGRAEAEAGAAELDAAQAQLDEQAAQLEAGRAMMPAEQIAAAEQQLAAGQAQVDAGRAELAAGNAQLDAAQAEIDTGLGRLEQGEADLTAGEAELDQGERLAALTDGVRQVSENGTVAMAQIRFDAVGGGTLPAEVTEAVQEIGADLEGTGVEVDYSTEVVSDVSSVMGPGEAIGLVIAAIVLLVMLGSLLAAGLPLLVAAVGVAVGIGGALALSAVVEMTSVTPALALMLGLAVGIDYSLFILNRHRIQLSGGMARTDSIALATGTAGNAVTFAGMTVVIALAALTVTGIPFLAVMGLVAAATVVVAVLAAITLTPALLSLLGERVLPRRRRGAARAAGERRAARAAHPAGAATAEPTGSRRESRPSRSWGAVVQRYPWLAIVGVVVLAGVLASPVQQLRLGLPDGSAEPADSTAYRTYDLIRDNFGAGANGPLIVVATPDEVPADDAAVTTVQLDVAEDLAGVEGVEYVVPFGVSEDRSTLAFQLVPAEGPSTESTVDLVHRLDDAAPVIGEARGATLGLTGQTVANIDISERLADALPVYLAVVIGLSLVLLLLVFRSIWVPLLATAGFLLSLAAAFGGIVATYQLGIGSGIFGVHEPGPILSFLPIILIGVLFGLAMDYQVFLVSAIRESYVHGENVRAAVVSGFDHSARVVTAAAIIMVSVFGGFIFAELTMIRPIGFGLALGVLVDAFLLRMTLTPAVLSLLGERAWWLPRWLDRALPDVDVEGAKLERSLGIDDGEQPHAVAQPAPVR
ncbi:MMPL family transporter [Georgenia muralis]|uniref:RND superfamily putative drug exporter n=1 Tax=Georgenia muralis TaxID=154117 RepID=A0A3N4ZAY6_9MICO|nr:MMPL family transporter [Georgenia muralis]RPF29096.1 RND superfamily putative drug exporter [Georgenia muralis]